MSNGKAGPAMKKNILLGGVIISTLLNVAMAIQADANDHSDTQILIDSREIRFVGKSGKLNKRISLKPETKIETGVVNIVGKGKVPMKVRKEILKDITMTPDQRRLVFKVNEAESGYIDKNGKIQEYNEWKWATGKITYMDESGNVLWEKYFKKYHAVEKVIISENKEAMAVTVSCYDRDVLEPQEQYGTIYVFNSQGQELLRWPNDNTEYKEILFSNSVFSPSGRYLSVSARAPTGIVTLVFFDLKNNLKFWDSNKAYGISRISNEGIAKVNDPNSGTTRLIDIDLKKYLGD